MQRNDNQNYINFGFYKKPILIKLTESLEYIINLTKLSLVLADAYNIFNGWNKNALLSIMSKLIEQKYKDVFSSISDAKNLSSDGYKNLGECIAYSESWKYCVSQSNQKNLTTFGEICKLYASEPFNATCEDKFRSTKIYTFTLGSADREKELCGSKYVLNVCNIPALASKNFTNTLSSGVDSIKEISKYQPNLEEINKDRFFMAGLIIIINNYLITSSIFLALFKTLFTQGYISKNLNKLRDETGLDLTTISKSNFKRNELTKTFFNIFSLISSLAIISNISSLLYNTCYNQGFQATIDNKDSSTSWQKNGLDECIEFNNIMIASIGLMLPKIINSFTNTIYCCISNKDKLVERFHETIDQYNLNNEQKIGSSLSQNQSII